MTKMMSKLTPVTPLLFLFLFLLLFILFPSTQEIRLPDGSVLNSNKNNPFFPNPMIVKDKDGGSSWKKQNSGVKLSQSDWMGKNRRFIQDKRLLDITLPGSHDSGAFYLTTSLLPGYVDNFLEDLIELAERIGIPFNDLITPWALSQDRTFYEQLSAGIRYLDLRSGWNGTAWRTFHFELGYSVEELLNQVARFLHENEGEIVIVEVSHLIGNPLPSCEKEKILAQIIEKTVGQYLFPRREDLNFTVGEMLSTGKRALVTISADCVLGDHPGLWDQDTIYNTFANTDSLEAMTTFNTKMVEEYNHNKTVASLFKFSWTLTPVVTTVLEGLLPGFPHSLKELADTANGKPFDLFLAECKQKGWMIGNIFIIDHFETSHIIEVINSNLY